jgi:hypothetical protein
MGEVSERAKLDRHHVVSGSPAVGEPGGLTRDQAEAVLLLGCGIATFSLSMSASTDPV